MLRSSEFLYTVFGLGLFGSAILMLYVARSKPIYFARFIVIGFIPLSVLPATFFAKAGILPYYVSPVEILILIYVLTSKKRLMQKKQQSDRTLPLIKRIFIFFSICCFPSVLIDPNPILYSFISYLRGTLFIIISYIFFRHCLTDDSYGEKLFLRDLTTSCLLGFLTGLFFLTIGRNYAKDTAVGFENWATGFRYRMTLWRLFPGTTNTGPIILFLIIPLLWYQYLTSRKYYIQILLIFFFAVMIAGMSRGVLISILILMVGIFIVSSTKILRPGFILFWISIVCLSSWAIDSFADILAYRFGGVTVFRQLDIQYLADFVATRDNAADRIYFWNKTIDVLRSGSFGNLMLGYGIDAFNIDSSWIRGIKRTSSVHNTTLTLFYNNGLLAATAFVFMSVIAILRFMKRFSNMKERLMSVGLVAALVLTHTTGGSWFSCGSSRFALLPYVLCIFFVLAEHQNRN